MNEPVLAKSCSRLCVCPGSGLASDRFLTSDNPHFSFSNREGRSSGKKKNGPFPSLFTPKWSFSCEFLVISRNLWMHFPSVFIVLPRQKDGRVLSPHSPSRTTVLRPVSSRYVSVLPQVTTTRNTRTATSLVCLSDLQSKFNRFLRFLSWACLGQTIVSQQKAESECWKYCCVFCFGTRPVRPLPWNCRCETPFFPSQPCFETKKGSLVTIRGLPRQARDTKFEPKRPFRFGLCRFVSCDVSFVSCSCRVVSCRVRFVSFGAGSDCSRCDNGGANARSPSFPPPYEGVAGAPGTSSLRCVSYSSCSFFEFSLCLSRACLGKIILFIYKWLKRMGFELWTLKRWGHKSNWQDKTRQERSPIHRSK